MAQATIETTVSGLQGVPISATPPVSGQVLVYNGTAWVASADLTGLTGLQVAGPIVQTGANNGITSAGNIATTGSVIAGNNSNNNGNIQVVGPNQVWSSWVTNVPDGGLGWAPQGATGTVMNVDISGNFNITGGIYAAGSVNSGSMAGIYATGTLSDAFGLYQQSNINSLVHSFLPGVYMGYDIGNGNWAWNNTNGNIFTIWANGDLSIAGSLTQASDIALKTDISDATEGLDVVQRLKVKHFRRKLRGSPDEIGFIAQDVLDVLPQAVSDMGKVLGITPTALIGVMINAIKELSTKVTALEGRQ